MTGAGMNGKVCWQPEEEDQTGLGVCKNREQEGQKLKIHCPREKVVLRVNLDGLESPSQVVPASPRHVLLCSGRKQRKGIP